MKIFNYSKLVYKTKTPEKPKIAPKPGVDKKLEERRRKKDKLLALKKTAAERHRKNKDELYKYWVENNPGGKLEAHKELPSYLALREIENKYLAKETFLLLRLIEKNWGVEEAWREYNNTWDGNKFDLAKLRKFFTKENAGTKIGFYYGTRKITWKPGWSAGHYIDPRNWWGDKSKTFKLTGWFVVKEGESNKNEYNTDHADVKKFIKEIKGDIYTKTHFLYKAKDIVLKLLGKSGVQLPKQKVLAKQLNENKAKARSIEPKTVRNEIYKWFNKQPKNKWLQPTQEIVSKLAFVYGRGCTNYLYRYEPKQKKIYLIPLQGQSVPGKWYGGYIDVRNSTLGSTWYAMDKKNTEKMLKALIKVKSATEVNSEVTDYRLKTKPGETIPKSEKLSRTKGMIATLKGVTKNVEYNNLDTGYLDVVKKRLIALLKSKGVSPDIAKDLAGVRISKLKELILSKINTNEALRKAIKDNPKTRLLINVNSNDEVSVVFGRIKDKTKYQKLISKGKKVVNSVASRVKETMNKIEAMVKKKFGKGSPIVMFFLNSVFKIKEGIKKMFSGKSAPVTGIVLGFLGIKVSKDILSSKKLRQADFDKLIPKGKKEYVFKSKRYLPGPIQLKKRKIIIPKGKGIKIGAKLDKKYVRVDGNPVTLDPKAKKGAKKKGFFGLFGGGKDEVLFKKNEIVILDGATIPKDTIIPKGTKVKVT